MPVEREGYGWVNKNLTFTEAMTLSSIADQADPPFKALTLRGDQTGDNRNIFQDWDGTGMLQLNDNDTIGKSAAMYFKVNDNWRMKVAIATMNGGYFTSNIKQSFRDSDMATVQEVGLLSESSIAVAMGFPDTFWDTMLNPESVMAVSMTGGDYISVDIDEEFDGVFRFRLKVNGTFRNVDDPDNMDDDTYFALLELEHFEELGMGDNDIDNSDSVLDPFDSEDLIFDGDGDGEDDGDYGGGSVPLVCGEGRHIEMNADGEQYCVDDIIPTEDANFFDYLIFGGVGFLILTLLGLVKRGA